VEENGNQPFFLGGGGKWTVEENGISFFEEMATALFIIYDIRLVITLGSFVIN